MSDSTTPLNHKANQSYSEDEIDIFEVFQSIWREKKIVISITLICTVVAFFFAVSSPKVYEVKSIIKPINTKALDEINSTGLYSITPEEALNQIGTSLESHDIRLDFLVENKDLFQYFLSNKDEESAVLDISRSHLSMVNGADKKSNNYSNFVGVNFQYPEGVDGPAILNKLIKYAIEIEKSRILSNLATVVTNKVHTITNEINDAREAYNVSKEAEIAQLLEKDELKRAQLNDELVAIRDELKARRENRINVLDEAIMIASTLGIEKPTTPSALSYEQGTSGNIIKTEINSNTNPIYYLGTEALNAERQSLLARKDDDFTSNRLVELKKELSLLENNRKVEQLKSRTKEDLFLPNLPVYRQELNKLSKLDINIDNLKLVRVDQRAIKPGGPIKPKKMLIVIAGIMLGLMLGIFIALLRVALVKRKLNA